MSTESCAGNPTECETHTNGEAAGCVWLIPCQFTVPVPVHINYKLIDTYRQGFKTAEFHILCITEVKVTINVIYSAML
jgi:hypothetical protein